MNDMGRFVLFKERLCRRRITEKCHEVNQHGQVAEKKARGGEMEAHLPKVGITRAGKNPGLAISASEA